MFFRFNLSLPFSFSATFSISLIGGLAAFASVANEISFTDPLDGQLDMSQAIAKNPYAFIPMPILITEPSVGYGAGLFGLFLHESDDLKKKRQNMALKPDDASKFTPPNYTVVGGAATENGTWFAGIAHRHTWKEDSIRYHGEAGYANINMDIYKHDSIFSSDNPLHIESNGFETNTNGGGAKQSLLFQMADSPLYLGMSQFWFRSEVSVSDLNIPSLSQSSGRENMLQKAFGGTSTSSALGLMAEYDTRDNIFYPRKGGRVDVEYLLFRDAFGSDYEYDSLEIEGQYYVPLSILWTLGFSTQYQSISGDKSLPPLAKPYIDLRGIGRYRYQGNYVLSGQTQLMWQVNPRWTLQTFVGIGSASATASDLYDTSEMAYGGGVRYLMARSYGIKMGVDLAFSDEDSAFYITLGNGF